MNSRYSEKECQGFIEAHPAIPKELAIRVYVSRLIGQDGNLVLHGGGNTSVKLIYTNILGERIDSVFVKGSGHDLATIGPEGFSGLDLRPLRKLRRLDTLPDDEMENQLMIHRLSVSSPSPSVESLLHAFLPHRYVDHTHADSILVLTHLKDGDSLIRRILGPKAAVIPYARSGLALAKSVIDRFDRQPDINAVVIMNHGIFTFSNDARRSYECMIAYVHEAERYIQRSLRITPPAKKRVKAELPRDTPSAQSRCAQVVRGVCARPIRHQQFQRVYVDFRTSEDIIAASLSEDAETLCISGVLTPDHVIHTKNRMVYIDCIPEDDESLIKVFRKGVQDFDHAYHRYIDNFTSGSGIDREAVDYFPILFLVAGIGLLAAGNTRLHARIAADIGEHTIRAKIQALTMGNFQPTTESHVFDMEFWKFQLKKIEKVSSHPLQGQIALVTGGGGAIGYGIADRLLAAGAAVVIADIDIQRLKHVHHLLSKSHGTDRVDCIVFDVTDYPAVEEAFAEVSRKMGGIDIVVPNAGIAHVAKIEDLDPRKFDQVVAVNLKGTFTVIKAAIPVFKRQGTGGHIVVISSKNVFDPGVAFGAYSASKAGAHQISKIAALELAELGVRVNMINPDAVFGDEKVCSNLWMEVGPERMKSRGLDPEGLKDYYCRRSLLKVQVLAEHVGNAVVFFASNLTPTTGATLPVDAGNPATFSR